VARSWVGPRQVCDGGDALAVAVLARLERAVGADGGGGGLASTPHARLLLRAAAAAVARRWATRQGEEEGEGEGEGEAGVTERLMAVAAAACAECEGVHAALAADAVALLRALGAAAPRAALLRAFLRHCGGGDGAFPGWREGLSLGDAKSSLGDAKSSLGDAESSRWVTLRARWVALRARWVTLRALAG
jgi:hypothetical protein